MLWRLWTLECDGSVDLPLFCHHLLTTHEQFHWCAASTYTIGQGNQIFAAANDLIRILSPHIHGLSFEEPLVPGH